MAAVVYVHGTGVREPAYSRSFEEFSKGLAEFRPDDVAVPCYWGEPYGSRLGAGGRSIPSGVSGRDVVGDEDEDEDVAIWALLERDPLAELRLLSEAAPSPESSEDRPPNAAAPGERVAEISRALAFDASVAPAVSAAGLSGTFLPAVDAVVDSEPAAAAMALEFELGGDLFLALARAFVAEAMRLADEDLGGTLPLDGDRRDALVAAIVARLGGSDRGAAGRIGRAGVEIALRLGVTRPVERRRAAITQAAAPAAGDVVMYLARGAGIRRCIAEAVTRAAELQDDVVLVGHSLGGVASLELLATTDLLQVRLLVTVGSQAPYLYELNALPTLEFGADLPDTVPAWVNVFDRRDLLSYTGEGIFPGRVIDHELDNRAPFPRSHSAYVGNPRFYSLLDGVMP
jgi:hypothetical protein